MQVAYSPQNNLYAYTNQATNIGLSAQGLTLNLALTLTLTLTGADDDDGRQSRLGNTHVEPIGHLVLVDLFRERPVF